MVLIIALPAIKVNYPYESRGIMNLPKSEVQQLGRRWVFSANEKAVLATRIGQDEIYDDRHWSDRISKDSVSPQKSSKFLALPKKDGEKVFGDRIQKSLSFSFCLI